MGMGKPYIIADLGVNYYDTAAVCHITPLEAAMQYIDAAKEAGIDAVKFQAYRADTLAAKASPAYWDTTKEPALSQHELFMRYESFGETEYALLSSHCKEIEIDFLCTPFDLESVEYLQPMMAAYKISSSDLNNLPFIRSIAKKQKPVILSVGASYLSEVEEAVRVLREENCPDITLLHCVLSYPCHREDANLNIIRTLKRVFPELKIGFSDHTEPDENMMVLTTAYLLGAEVLEKHFTLDKSLPGNDHYHAGNPEDFKKAIQNFALVDTLTGSGEKTVLRCEAIPRKEARRSLVLTRSMQAGEVITEEDVLFKRPGTGISPNFLSTVLGRVVKFNLPQDTILTWDMI